MVFLNGRIFVVHQEIDAIKTQLLVANASLGDLSRLISTSLLPRNET